MRKPNYTVILFIVILFVVSVASFLIKTTVPKTDSICFWSDWDVPSFLLNIFLSGILLVGITLPQYRQEKYKERVDDFKKVSDELATDSNRYTEEALAGYKKEYKDECFKKEDGYLLYKEGWMPKNLTNNSEGFGNSFLYLDMIHTFVVRTEETENNYLKIKRNKKLPDTDEGYAENVKFFTNRTMYNGRMYGFKDFTFREDRRLLFYVLDGNYYDYYSTCEYLSYESAYAKRILGKKNDYWGKKYLPERFSEENVFSPTKRFAGIGISTITILKNVVDDDVVKEDGKDYPKKTFFILHKRSANVAQGMNNFHVIPAGGYEPVESTLKNNNQQNSEDVISPHIKNRAEPMVNTVLREFGEELLGFEEYFDLSKTELLEDLKEVVHPVFLGVGFEPLNTMLDVLTAVVLDVQELNQKDKKINGKPLFSKLSIVDGKRTYKPVTAVSEIEEVLNANANFEGRIALIPFDEKMLSQYEKDMRSTAGLKQIMKIMQYDNVRSALSVEYNE